MASILKVDELRGIVSAGDITVTSEGGAATMQLQQGLAKAWASFTFSTFASRDTFGASSLTDNATGDCRINLTNNMSSANYAVFGSGCDAVASFTGGQRAGGGYCLSSSVAGVCFTYQNNGAVDSEIAHGMVAGDLA
jgi:hypothetical protein